MPITFDKIFPDGSHLALWDIEEDEDFFLSSLNSNANEQDRLNKFTAKHRRLEWLSVRLLLQTILKKTIRIVYDSYGRPTLPDENIFLSISHSKNMAGIFIHPQKKPGLDIEFISNKVEKVKHKFMSQTELEQLSHENHSNELLLYWCAKECLLKIYGRKDIDFIKHLKIYPFAYTNKGSFKAEIRINEAHSTHTMWHINYNNYFIVFGF
ncbi:MAG: 4'-phosphopantetheinyl transferase superfamily protein [Bacteroidota bacterium]|nr:4'-phosphopantetheinyl transferase superfamily protein [Bacteroidota bacterium]